MTYELIDSGEGEKLEQFGRYLLARPCSYAFWKKRLPKRWGRVDSRFKRGKGWSQCIQNAWNCEYREVILKVMLTDFGHVGLFPEHSQHWSWMQNCLGNTSANILNLFAYSGSSTVWMAKHGHSVCHVDASPGMVDWARENAQLNELDQAPVRWIVDDVMKFLKREIRRKTKYDGLVIDPPSFGRGTKGQVFKIENDLAQLLLLCKEVLRPDPLFVVLTCHTPGFTPQLLENILWDYFPLLKVESGEMMVAATHSCMLPAGIYVRGTSKNL